MSNVGMKLAAGSQRPSRALAMRLVCSALSALPVLAISACGDVAAPPRVLSAIPMDAAASGGVTIASNAWTNAASLTYARGAPGVVTYDGCVWAIGGYNNTVDAMAEVERLCPVISDRWTAAPPLPAARSRFAGVGVIGSRIYVAGGTDASGFSTSSLYVYSSDAGWRLAAEPLPFPIACGASAVANGKLYVYGWRPIEPETFGSDCNLVFEPVFAVFDPKATPPRWRVLPAEPSTSGFPASRCLHAMASLGELVYVFGGTPYGCDLLQSEIGPVGAFNTTTEQWLGYGQVAWPDEGRLGQVVVSHGGRLYAIGGQNGDVSWATRTEVKGYEPASNAWAPLRSLPTDVELAGGTSIGSSIVVVGGGSVYGRGGSTDVLQLKVGRGCDVHEPDGSVATANEWFLRGDAVGLPLKPYGMQLGAICTVGDVDYYLISPEWSEAFDVALYPPAGADYQLELLNARGTDVLQKSAQNGAGPEFVSSPGGRRRYLIRVRSQNGSFDSARPYYLEVR